MQRREMWSTVQHCLRLVVDALLAQLHTLPLTALHDAYMHIFPSPLRLDPEWLSVNLGVLICIECSGQHRDLSVQFSRIRSIKLDDLHSSELLVARVMGNQLFNEVMEATLPAGQKPAGNSPMSEKKNFIHSKYIDRKYVDMSQTDADYTIQHELREAVNCRDIRQLLQTYAEGADMCAPLPDRVSLKWFADNMAHGGGVFSVDNSFGRTHHCTKQIA